jgi:hypothetical protein
LASRAPKTLDQEAADRTKPASCQRALRTITNYTANQAAMEVLILTAEHGQNGADPMMARIAMMRALTADKPKSVPKRQRKRAKAYRIVR